MPGFKLMLDDAANAKVFYPDWTRPTGGAPHRTRFRVRLAVEVDPGFTLRTYTHLMPAS